MGPCSPVINLVPNVCLICCKRGSGMSWRQCFQNVYWRLLLINIMLYGKEAVMGQMWPRVWFQCLNILPHWLQLAAFNNWYLPCIPQQQDALQPWDPSQPECWDFLVETIACRQDMAHNLVHFLGCSVQSEFLESFQNTRELWNLAGWWGVGGSSLYRVGYNLSKITEQFASN